MISIIRMKRGIEMKKVLAIVLLFVTILAGCSSNEVDLLFSSFDEKLVNKDFEGLYLLLSSESQAAITQEEFVTRYNNIYSGIEASNLKTEMGEIDTENEVIPFSLTMDTVAGNFSSSDYELPYIKENGELKILWSEALIFPMMESGDKVRVVTKNSTRGSILDRNGEALASDGTLKIIGIHPAEFDDNNRESKISELATLLDIDEDTIIKKLDANSNPDYFVPIVTVLPGTSLIQFLSNREHEGILIRNTQGRIYKNEEAFGRLLGYIGEITAEQLEADEEGIYTRNSLIGKAGLEQVYEETLRGIDGMEVYIERDGTNIETIALTEARNGSDIKLSIDPNLQVKIYETMNGEKGSATAVDPTTGEILALVSSPSYNSNRYTTYMTNSAAMNIGVHVSLSDLVSLVCMPRSGIAGSYGSSILKFYFVLLVCIIPTLTTGSLSDGPGEQKGQTLASRVMLGAQWWVVGLEPPPPWRGKAGGSPTPTVRDTDFPSVPSSGRGGQG